MKEIIYKKIVSGVLKVATVISPTLNTKLRYRIVFKKPLNLKSPQTFNEKLLWLKINKYNDDPLVIQCADKYKVREYICKCGYPDILNNLIGVWDAADQIPWESLPQRFVLKWNFGAGMNIICKNKDAFSKEAIIRQMKKWEKNKCWLSHSEMHYKYMQKKIICEDYIEFKENKSIPDYKVYCFHGEPKAIFVMHNRECGEIKTEFFDTDWKKLNNSGKYSSIQKETDKPECLERLLKISACLSKPFPFVRCDFYIVENRIYFGELTFTPAGGMYTSQTKIEGKDMAEFLHLENL